MVKVSVIIPCYNVAQWLARCLDSVINQTMGDIEIICIDDKSTDNTAQILAEYAARDTRIRPIYFDTNRGVATARNAGLDMACGEYIGFVDPDDFIDNDFYEKLYKLAVERNMDVVCGNVISTHTPTNTSTPGHDILNQIDRDYRAFVARFWAAIYRRKLLVKHKIRFPDGIISAQDVVFLNDVILAVSDVAVCYDTFYHYFFLRDGALDSEWLSHAKAQSKYDAVCLIIESIKRANMGDDERRFMIGRRPMAYLAYALNTKRFELDSDRKQSFDLLVKLAQEYDCYQYLAQYIPADVVHLVTRNDYDGWRRCVDTSCTWFCLFGFIPLISVQTYQNRTRIRLFNLVTILGIRDHRKFMMFGFIPILKIRTRNGNAGA